MLKFLLCCMIAGLFLVACGDDSTSNAINNNGGADIPPQQGPENNLPQQESGIPCDATLEGLVLSTVDGENSLLCTNGAWIEILSSSSTEPVPDLDQGIEAPSSSSGIPGQAGNDIESSSSVVLSSSSSVIQSEVEGSSSSSEIPGQAGNDIESSSSMPIPSSSSVILSSSSSVILSDSEGSSSSVRSSSSSLIAESSSCSEVMPSSSSNEESSSSEMISSSSEPKSSSSEYYKSNWVYLEKDIVYDTIIDSRDNQVYKIVTIGSQTWMAENLNFYDESIKNDALCLYNKTSYCKKFGRLYNLPAALQYDSLETYPWSYVSNNDSLNIRGICPDGWRIPTYSEWKPVGEKFKYHIGISILAGSGIYYAGKGFYTDSEEFWTTSEHSYNSMFVAHFEVNNGYFPPSNIKLSNKQSTFVSIRCIKDSD